MDQKIKQITFHDSLTGRNIEIRQSPRLVKLYNCGLTVSDYAHIGHARNALFCDTIIRFLRWSGYQTLYVCNITDVQDKITTKSEALNISPFEVADRYLSFWEEDLNWLGVIKPDVMARASQNIHEIIEAITLIISSGHAYVQDGWVFFNVSSFSRYGKLSRLDRTEMLNIIYDKRSYERGKPNPRDDIDFTLWQPTMDLSPGWVSPWGYGRPGKHIECSSIIAKYLGNDVDIHVGGADLKFPHHECELAQSVSAWGSSAVARTWMHNGEVDIGNVKMAKSAGNAVYLKDIKTRYKADLLRLLMLQTHYDEKIHYSQESLEVATSTLEDLTKIKAYLEVDLKYYVDDVIKENIVNDFYNALKDDLNTQKALGILLAIPSQCGNYQVRSLSSLTFASVLFKELSDVLGLSL